MTGSKPGEERCFEIGYGLDIDFRWVPPGEFMMGSPPNEIGRSEDENQKLVRIKEGFWLAEHETTVLSWLKVMEIKTSGKINVQDLAQKPVVHVSWHDCQQFLKRLPSPAPGWRYVLPSEAQWEYACRAGSRAAYSLPPTDLGWIASNSGGHSHAVGMKQANAWGLQDMQGNVAEWCRDWVGPNNSEVAIRGGSWESDFTSRAAARNSDTPFLRINRVGLRLALVREESISAMPVSPAFDISEIHTR